MSSTAAELEALALAVAFLESDCRGYMHARRSSGIHTISAQTWNKMVCKLKWKANEEYLADVDVLAAPQARQTATG